MGLVELLERAISKQKLNEHHQDEPQPVQSERADFLMAVKIFAGQGSRIINEDGVTAIDKAGQSNIIVRKAHRN